MALAQAARQARALADRYETAAEGERLVAASLVGLTVDGWRLLVDRRWPGTEAANIDMILVGPGGVFVIDVKNWRDTPAVAGDRLVAGEADRHGEVGKLLAQAYLAERAVGEIGLSPIAVAPVMVFAGHRINRLLGRVMLLGQVDAVPALLALPRRLTPAQVKMVTTHLADAFPEYDRPSVADRPAPAPNEQADDPPALFDVEQVRAAQLAADLAAPIEGWMTFLHPDQAKLVRRSFLGPARLSGPAGTGKTVVGLHRSVYLAQRSTRPVLFVTFATNLPRVQQALARRLAPATAGRIEFTSLHAFAGALLAARGIAVRIRGEQTEFALGRAWQNVGRRGILAQTEPNPRYWFDEINYVIKGRGIDTLPHYLGAERRGRRTALHGAQREAVWALFQEYERLRTEAGIHDFNDVLALALTEARRAPLKPAYAAVVVDEVQDLTLTGVRLLHTLVGDVPNGLLLIGDGQQAVYPGGYRLTDAGIAVSGGRAMVLGTNYRNRAEILAAALEVVSGYSFEDIDESTSGGDRPVETVFHGGQVTRVRTPGLAEHDEALLAALLAPGPGDGGPDAGWLGDAAVLCETRQEVDRYHRLLTRAGIPVQKLEVYDGTPTDGLKLGTYTRVKGLDFKHVFLPRHDLALRDLGGNGASVQERRELASRRLYVAMTRARDSLWLGSAGNG
ncbi:MAG TPA: UvrD-helicase domain-containing protein [Actinocrinis sp.]